MTRAHKMPACSAVSNNYRLGLLSTNSLLTVLSRRKNSPWRRVGFVCPLLVFKRFRQFQPIFRHFTNNSLAFLAMCYSLLFAGKPLFIWRASWIFIILSLHTYNFLEHDLVIFGIPHIFNIQPVHTITIFLRSPPPLHEYKIKRQIFASSGATRPR